MVHCGASHTRLASQDAASIRFGIRRMAETITRETKPLWIKTTVSPKISAGRPENSAKSKYTLVIPVEPGYMPEVSASSIQYAEE